MNLSENALRVLHTRYLIKDEAGRVMETPSGMFRRIARTIAGAEALYGGDSRMWEGRFFEIMTKLRRRHRLLCSPAPAEGRHRPLDRRHRQRAGLIHEDL